MAVFQVKKYKTIKDENGNKIQVEKTKEEWNKETCGGTKIYYFSDRYKINNKIKQYKSGVFALKREAEAEERLFLTDPVKYILEHSKRARNSLKLDLVNNNNEMTLNDYFPLFLKYKLECIRGSSVYNDKVNWRKHLKDTFGYLKPKEVTLAKIQYWRDIANSKINLKTKNLYAIKTKNSWHNTISELLQFLYIKGIIEINYAKVIGCFKKTNINKNEKKKIKYQTEEEFNLFMSVVDDQFWYKFFNFLFWHGPRKGEQRALKIEDVKLEYDSITFDETFARDENGGEKLGPIKNGIIGTIYIAKQSKPYIEELINFYRQMEGYSDNWFLFGGPVNTNKNRIERALKRYYDILEEKYPDKKIVRLSHHEFGRHSHASYLLNEGLKKGIPIEELYAIIAQRLRDSIEVVKSTYAHLYEKETNDRAKNILN